MRNRLIVCVVASAALAIPLMGGDWGWGNCGHNSSVGQPHTGDQGIGLGNGGDRKDECLAPIIPS